MPDRIVEEELALLRQVNARLEEPPRGAPSADSIVHDLEDLRTAIAEATRPDDQAALLQQWDRQSALLHQLRGARRPGEVDLGSPYFAHMRLAEDGGEQDVLLGKTTRLLRDAPIVDWRDAPISRLFYAYRQGEPFEEEIAGRVRTGVLTARRTVTVRDAALRRVEAPEGTFEPAADGWHPVETDTPRLGGGQGTALRAHDVGAGVDRRFGTGGRRRADTHLPDIVALIDPTQFELVSRPAGGFLLIRGTAGSGKTTVTLHRIAYLAYHDPAIDSSATLVVVFSPALRDYVSHVLPALGVTGVHVRTFREWAAEQCARLSPSLPRARREYTPAIVSRLKLHPAIGIALAEHVRSVAAPATADQAIDDWASVLCRPAFLEQVLAREAPGAFSAEQLARATDWNRVRLEELLAWRARERGAEAELDEEDEALLLRAWQLRVGPLVRAGGRMLRYRHVAVDEVQDFSPVEVQVLLDCLDDRRSITLAGDTQQHLVAEGGFTSWGEFLAQLGLEGTEMNTLRVSYRCSSEIAEFARGLLGDAVEEPAPPVTVRSGPPVELFRFTDHGACVAFLADALGELVVHEPLASVAVLTPSAELSALYHRGLVAGEVPRLRRVEQQTFTFAPGVEVTEIEQTKGLEFDYVVLVETSTTQFPDTPAARRRLHVGATRAVHQLWLTSVGTPAAAVRSIGATR